MGRRGEGLDVVDHRRHSQVSALDGERRFEPGGAPLAFARLDECGLVPADVGAGPQLDADVEATEALGAVAQDAAFPQRGEPALQVVGEIGVFGSQVDDAADGNGGAVGTGGTDGVRGDGHPGEHRVGFVRQQRPVLEGSRLTFVGVADDVFGRPRRRPAGLPFGAGGKSRSSPAPQAGRGEGGDHLVGGLRPASCEQAFVISLAAEEHRARGVHGAGRQGLDVGAVMPGQPTRVGQLLGSAAAFEAGDDLTDGLRGQAGEHDSVDEHRRFLVTEPDARGLEQPELRGGGFAEADTGLSLQRRIHLVVTVHFGNDRVAQINSVAAGRGGMEEVVERRSLEHVLDRHPEPVRDRRGSLGRDVSGAPLHLPQHVQQAGAVATVTLEHGCDVNRHRGSTTHPVRFDAVAAGRWANGTTSAARTVRGFPITREQPVACSRNYHRRQAFRSETRTRLGGLTR